MHPLVRNLYKRFIVAGRYYPDGLNSIKSKIKADFFKNRHLTSELEIKKAVANGRYWVREIIAISKLKKYRAMKRRYDKEVDRYG